ncbi:3-hydroxyacyl-ACP dehydratase FabZ [Alphaproteobacteria bacterium]|nr:3-hydroxyacyl-ACP dehydratase FabZ [Alphaproteobacteria bacterium]
MLAAQNMDTCDISLDEIKKLIPHRYPMLLVDCAIDVVPGERGTGIKCVTANEPFFQGHFPHYPIMPGVLIIEALAQTAGIIVNKSLPPTETEKVRSVYFMSIDSARFRQPVEPGMKLHLEVDKIKSRGGVWKYAGKATCDGKVMTEAVFTAMIVESDA